MSYLKKNVIKKIKESYNLKGQPDARTHVTTNNSETNTINFIGQTNFNVNNNTVNMNTNNLNTIINIPIVQLVNVSNKTLKNKKLNI